jgi:hypothetical protein
MAQALSRRLFTAEVWVQSGPVRVGLVVDKVILGQVFTPSTSVPFTSTNPAVPKTQSHIKYILIRRTKIVKCDIRNLQTG